MSHFTVLVIGNNPEEQLAPFQENNMEDCPKEYLEFNDVEDKYLSEYKNDTVTKVVMPDGRLLNSWDEEFRVSGQIGFGTHSHNVPDELDSREVPYTELYSTFEEFMSDWKGYSSRDEQMKRYGYWENPNAKWDWYQLGGRWTGFFKLKEDANKEFAITGTPGLMASFAKDGYVDTALKKDIDIDGMVAETIENAKDRYDKIAKLFPKGIPVPKKSWNELCNDSTLDWKERKNVYKEDPAVIEWEEVINQTVKSISDSELESFYNWARQDDYAKSRNEYIQSFANSVLNTFAVIKDGKWYEKGEMGWWGAVSNKKDNDEWNKEFTKLIAGLPDNTLLSIYDCHI